MSEENAPTVPPPPPAPEATSEAVVATTASSPTVVSPITSTPNVAIPAYKPVSQMSAEEIAEEARKILLSSPRGLGSSGRYGAAKKNHTEEDRNDDDYRNDNYNASDAYAADDNTNNDYYNTYGSGMRSNSGNSSARSALKKATPRDTFGDDSRVDASYCSDSDAALNRSARRVVVTDEKQYAEQPVEMIDLPLSLALLYQAAYALQVKQPSENLQKMLLDIAVINGTSRMAADAEAERLRRDACHRLFVNSSSHKTRLEDKRETIRKQLLEEEDKECTFKPTLSQHGQQIRRNYHTPSGKVDYVAMSAQSDEWLKAREKKLKAKALKAENDRKEAIEESMVPMSSKSKSLADRYRAKQEEKKALEAALMELTNKGNGGNHSMVMSQSRASPTSAAGSSVRPPPRNATSTAPPSMSPIQKSRDESRDGADGGDNEAASPNARAVGGDGEGAGEGDVSMAPTHLGDGEGGAHYGDDGTASHYSNTSINYNHTTELMYSKFVDMSGSADTDLLRKMQNYRRSVLGDRSNAEYYPSFEPVTNGAHAYDHYFKSGGAGVGYGSMSPMRNGRGSGGTAGGGSTPGAEGGADGGADDGQTNANARIVQRLLDDVEQRKVRQEERLREAEERRKEKLFDPLTGQPFFQPNAAPTIVIGKKRVPISELPPKEREEAVKILRNKKLDFLLSVAKKKENDGSPQRDVSAFLKYCDEMQAQAAKRMDKIRRLEDKELEGLFIPHVNDKSRKIAAQKSHDRPQDRELLRKEVPPPPPPKRESDAEAIKNMMERSKQWEDRKKNIQRRKANELMREEVKECTFNPKLRSKVSREMTAAAEQRLAGELAMLRSQQELLRIEDEQRALQQQQRLASRSVQSADRASCRSANGQQQMHSQSMYMPTSTGSHRRERPSPNDQQQQYAQSRSPMMMMTGSGPSAGNYYEDPNSGLDRTTNSTTFGQRVASVDHTTSNSSVRGGAQPYNSPSATGAAGATQLPPPQQQQQQALPVAEPSIDDLIDSWKELDELTDAILKA